MKKWLTGLLWAVMLTALSGVTAFADLIIPGQPRQPSPTPDPTPAAPDPAPVVPDPVPAAGSAQIDPALLTALIVGVALIAAAVIVWIVIRQRRARYAL